MQDINTETYLKNKKIKKENMGKIDIVMSEEEKKGTSRRLKRISKKILVSQKSLNIIIDKIVF